MFSGETEIEFQFLCCFAEPIASADPDGSDPKLRQGVLLAALSVGHARKRFRLGSFSGRALLTAEDARGASVTLALLCLSQFVVALTRPHKKRMLALAQADLFDFKIPLRWPFSHSGMTETLFVCQRLV